MNCKPIYIEEHLGQGRMSRAQVDIGLDFPKIYWQIGFRWYYLGNDYQRALISATYIYRIQKPYVGRLISPWMCGFFF